MNNYNRSIKETCQANSKFSIIKHKLQTTSLYLSVNDQLRDSKISKRQKSQQRKFSAMEGSQKDLQNLYKDATDSISVDRQLFGKENYLKICNYNNISNGKNNENDGKNNKSNSDVLRTDCYPPDRSSNSECLQDLTANRSNQSTLYSAYSKSENKDIIDNIDQDKEQGTSAHGETDDAADRDVVSDEEEDDNNGRSRTTSPSDEFYIDNTINQIKFKVNDKFDKDCKAEEEEEKNKISSHFKLLTNPLQTQAALAAFVETQTIGTAKETAHVQSTVNQHPSHQQFINDVGQQIRVQNILDVAGSLCTAEPIGALYNMAAFSKMHCSAHDDNQKDEIQNSTDFLAKKYYHPLYAQGVCRWPGCELPLEDMATFVNMNFVWRGNRVIIISSDLWSTSLASSSLFHP